MTSENLSTYDQIMQNPKRRQKFEEGYRTFVLVEILIPLLQKSQTPVRTLAKAAGVSPTIIQDIKSGKKEGISYTTFLALIEALGYQATLQIRKRALDGKKRRSPTQQMHARPLSRRRKRSLC